METKSCISFIIHLTSQSKPGASVRMTKSICTGQSLPSLGQKERSGETPQPCSPALTLHVNLKREAAFVDAAGHGPTPV